MRPLSTLLALHTLDISGWDQLGDVRPLPARVGLHTPNFHELSDARPLAILDAMATIILSEVP